MIKQSSTTTKNKTKLDMSNQQEIGVMSKHGWLVLFALILLLLFIAFQQNVINGLKENQLLINDEVRMIRQEMTSGFAKSRKVYVYDLERTLREVRLDDLNREFEAKINVLSAEVSSAQKKIDSLKKSKVKDDFSDVYLKSLKMKRDTMLQEYSRTLESLTSEINSAITAIAKEKGAVIIFDKRIISSQSENVVDVTDEVINRVRLSRPKILDE